MAVLRAEAVQARRLAAHIENLHRPAPRARKVGAMSASVADPGQPCQMTRRKTDAPAAGQLSFNPLHPSMELPPEQLIRLLGLEHKTRHRRKNARAASTPRPASGSPDTQADSRRTAPSNSPAKRARVERERDTTAPDHERSLNWLLPSLLVGAVAGIAGAWLLLGNGMDTPETSPAHEPTPPAAVVAPARPASPPAVTESPRAAKPAVPAATPGSAASQPAAAPVATPGPGAHTPPLPALEPVRPSAADTAPAPVAPPPIPDVRTQTGTLEETMDTARPEPVTPVDAVDRIDTPDHHAPIMTPEAPQGADLPAASDTGPLPDDISREPEAGFDAAAPLDDAAAVTGPRPGAPDTPEDTFTESIF